MSESLGERPAERVVTVGVDELFFSTTDRRGVITSGNSVFQRLAEYSFEEMIGAPHNLVRHPDMPAGVFKIMWERIAAGLPVAAYVKNRTKSGAEYWVVAVITPVRDQFLSIRSAPCAPSLWAAVQGLYDKVAVLERGARATGASKVTAAELGAAAILDGLKSIGFPSYDSFTKFVVPAETTARLALLGARPRPQASGALADLLDGTDAITSELSTLLGRLDGYQDLAASLLKASTDARATAASLRQSTGTASDVSISVAEQAPVLGRSAAGMVEIASATAQVVEVMAQELNRVRHGLLDLSYRIGLCQLVNDQVSAFAAEIAQEMLALQPVDEQARAIEVLCETLDTEITILARDIVVVNDGLRLVSERIVEAGDGLHRFQRDMATWRLLVPRYGVSSRLDPYISPIDHQLSLGYSQMGALRELSVLCASQGRPYDPERLRLANQVITEAGRRIL